MCEGLDGGMSALPLSSGPNACRLEDGYIPDYLLGDDETGAGVDAYWQGNAQAGEIGAYRAANEGTMGAPGVVEPVKLVPLRPGGVVLSGELNAPGGGGLQVSGVYDQECGFGVVVNANLAVQGSSADASFSGRVSAAAYNGSFENFNNGTETEIGAGAGTAVGYQARWDEYGNKVGDGLAIGLGGGISVSGSRSVTLFKAFSGCE